MSSLKFRLDICPIQEAIFEIKFSSKFPDDAVFGIFYNIINEIFTYPEIVRLPIYQIPENIRLNDPSLKYSAHYKLIKDNISIGLGPNVIFFSNIKPYKGWTNWNNTIINILSELIKGDCFKEIEQMGLRYINYFKQNLCDVSNFEINLSFDSIANKTFSFKTETNNNNFLQIIQLHNKINFQIDNKTLIGSIIDIDIISQKIIAENFIETIVNTIENLHKTES
ncbi:MAG: TIGR04255 family protein, partial [Endomicrobiaceae bacterium]